MNRHVDSDFDQRLADWLEEDPTQAPQDVLNIVLAAYPSIPQRRTWRVPWRYPSVLMNRLALVAAALLVAVVAIGGSMYLFGAPSGFGSRATPTPSVAPATPAASPSLATPIPTPNATACDLLTGAEVAASAAVGLSPGDAAPRALATTATSDCVYATGGGIGDHVAEVELTKPGGAAAFSTAKGIAGAQTVKDLGVQAVFDPNWGRLYVLKGDTLVSITAGTFQATTVSKLAQAKALALLIIPRM